MKSSKTTACGRQEPRIALEPGFAYTDGDAAAQLVREYGYALDPWQSRVIGAWLGRDGRDRFTATSCGLAVPRQNGKNALLEVRELYGIVCMGEHILHTAHEVKTARKAFNRLASFFENGLKYPELAAMVASIRRTNGQEAIELWAIDPDTLEPIVGEVGGTVEFSARSRGAARGFTVDTVVFDEAQELTDEQLDALLPTLAAAPSGNRQFIYTGTPPSPTTPGDSFARIRRSAMEKTDDSLAWHEWSVEKMPARDASGEELLGLAYETNPALGYRITPEFIQKEMLSMSADGFARERLGWWAEVGKAAPAIPKSVWEKAGVGSIAQGYAGRRTFGVKFTPDGSLWVLAGCRASGKGLYAVETIMSGSTDRGMGELVDFLVSRKAQVAAVAIDGIGAADTLCKELEGCPRGYVMRARTGDVIAAASGFLEALSSGKCVHTRQADTDKCADACPRRVIGVRGGWAFAEGGGCEPAPLDALSLALWAARNTKRNPRRRQRLQ